MCVSSGVTFVSTLKHNHCRYIFPCDEHSCASLEEVSREIYNHNCCTDIICVLGNCVSSGKLSRELCSHIRCTNILPVENSCDSAKEPLCKFLSAMTTVISFLQDSHVILQRAFFCEILKYNSHTQKLCLNLNRELQQLG